MIFNRNSSQVLIAVNPTLNQNNIENDKRGKCEGKGQSGDSFILVHSKNNINQKDFKVLLDGFFAGRESLKGWSRIDILCLSLDGSHLAVVMKSIGSPSKSSMPTILFFKIFTTGE